MTSDELIARLRAETYRDRDDHGPGLSTEDDYRAAIECVEALVRERDEARRVCVTMLEEARDAEREVLLSQLAALAASISARGGAS